MPSDVIMPALGMAQETGKVVRWLKAEGDEVTKGEALLEIETDKVTVEIEAPADGVLAGVRAAEGDDVPVGETIAVLLAAGEHVADEPVRGRVALASPKARRLAAERGIELSAVAGSGPGGAVVAADIDGARRDEPPALGVPAVWRLMAERTTESWRSVPHFYVRREVDASRLQTWRASARERQGQERVSHTDLLVKLVAEALRRHPRVNATWRDGRAAPAAQVNVGVAVALDVGLRLQ